MQNYMILQDRQRNTGFLRINRIARNPEILFIIPIINTCHVVTFLDGEVCESTFAGGKLLKDSVRHLVAVAQVDAPERWCEEVVGDVGQVVGCKPVVCREPLKKHLLVQRRQAPDEAADVAMEVVADTVKAQVSQFLHSSVCQQKEYFT